MIRVLRRPKVTIEIGPLLEDQWTGIPVFTRRLIQSLWRQDKLRLEFMFNLTRVPNSLVERAIQFGSGTFLRELYERTAVADFSPADRDSFFLFPSVKRGLGLAKIEASTVHDMSTLFMPETHEASNVAFHTSSLKDELNTNDVVFCVSEATRQALFTAFPSTAKKAVLLYQYADWPSEFELIEKNLPSVELGPFAVVIGTIEPRKNLALLVHALGHPEIRRSKLKFVVIGKKGWLVDKFLESLSGEQRERIVFTSFISEFSKYRLLKAAQFLIFPSVYEGFGIPALEAMSLGKPVLASRTSSLPEIVGDAGIFFDPFSPSDFSAAFGEISHIKKAAGLSERALRRSALFSREKMAAPVSTWVAKHVGRNL